MNISIKKNVVRVLLGAILASLVSMNIAVADNVGNDAGSIWRRAELVTPADADAKANLYRSSDSLYGTWARDIAERPLLQLAEVDADTLSVGDRVVLQEGAQKSYFRVTSTARAPGAIAASADADKSYYLLDKNGNLAGTVISVGGRSRREFPNCEYCG